MTHNEHTKSKGDEDFFNMRANTTEKSRDNKTQVIPLREGTVQGQEEGMTTLHFRIKQETQDLTPQDLISSREDRPTLPFSPAN